MIIVMMPLPDGPADGGPSRCTWRGTLSGKYLRGVEPGVAEGALGGAGDLPVFVEDAGDEELEGRGGGAQDYGCFVRYMF